MDAKLKEVFRDIYMKSSWGSNESPSGSGSEKGNARHMAEELGYFLKKHKVSSMLDIPCGDFNWMQMVGLEGVDYLGADIVDEVVAGCKAKHPLFEFTVLDAVTDELPRMDLIFCRDMLGHFSPENRKLALQNFYRSGARWLLATSFTKDRGYNEDLFLDGGWIPVNLLAKPYNLVPEAIISEHCTEGFPEYADKSLVLVDMSAQTWPAWLVPPPKAVLNIV